MFLENLIFQYLINESKYYIKSINTDNIYTNQSIITKIAYEKVLKQKTT